MSPPPPQPGPHLHPQQQSYSSLDRRVSSVSNTTYGPGPYPSQGPPSIRQTYYPSPQASQASFNPHTSYPQYTPPYQGFSGSLSPPSNPALSRAKSINSNANSPDYYGPTPPMEPPNSAYEPSPYPGLTSAQAYQAQVYMNNPNGPHPSGPRDVNPQRVSPAPPDRVSSLHKQNGGSGPIRDPPQLGIRLEHDDGRLGIDFTTTNNSNSSDLGTDESGSELPWARSEPNSVFSCCSRFLSFSLFDA